MPCGLHPRVFLQGHRKIWIHLLHGSPISYWSIHTSPSFLKYKDDMIFKSLIILVTHFLSLLLPFPLSLANYRSFLTGLPESESVKELVSCSVMSDSLWPQRLYSPWDSPGQNTGVGCHALLQGIFPTQRSSPCPYVAGRFFTVWATREACFTSKLLESKQTLLRSWDVSLKCKNDGVSLPPLTFKITHVQNKIHTSFTTVSEALSCSQSVTDSQAETRKAVHCWVILQLLCIWFINTLCGIWTEKFKGEFGFCNLKCKQV